MLGEVGRLHRDAGGDGPGLRRDLAEHRADQRGLACAVGAEDTHTLPRTDIPREVVHELPLARGDRDVVEFVDRLAQARAREGEELDVIARCRLALDEFIGRIDAEFWLRGARRSATTQPGKLLAQEILPPRLRGSLLPGALSLAQHECRVAAVVLLDAAVDDLPRAVAESIEEPSIVGDDDDRETRTRGQVIGKPRDHLDVEMVGRLIE